MKQLLFLFLVNVDANHCRHSEESLSHISRKIAQQETLEGIPRTLDQNGNNVPIKIGVKFIIEAIPSVNVQAMAFVTGFVIKQYWKDQRLELPHLKNITDPHCFFVVPFRYQRYIWTPGTTFVGVLKN